MAVDINSIKGEHLSQDDYRKGVYSLMLSNDNIHNYNAGRLCISTRSFERINRAICDLFHYARSVAFAQCAIIVSFDRQIIKVEGYSVANVLESKMWMLPRSRYNRGDRFIYAGHIENGLSFDEVAVAVFEMINKCFSTMHDLGINFNIARKRNNDQY